MLNVIISEELSVTNEFYTEKQIMESMLYVALEIAASNVRAVYQSAIIRANCTEAGIRLKILEEGDERLSS